MGFLGPGVPGAFFPGFWGAFCALPAPLALGPGDPFWTVTEGGPGD